MSQIYLKEVSTQTLIPQDPAKKAVLEKLRVEQMKSLGTLAQ